MKLWVEVGGELPTPLLALAPDIPGISRGLQAAEGHVFFARDGDGQRAGTVSTTGTIESGLRVAREVKNALG